jgi:kynurenine formamidase
MLSMSYPLWNQLEQLKSAEWVDLTHKFDDTIPCFSEDERASVKPLATVKDDGYYVQRWNLVTQYGTHLDAPNHFVNHARSLNDFELTEFALPLIVLDYSSEVAQDADFIVTKEHLTQWERINGKIEPHTFVALRTDWSKRWPDTTQFENKDTHGQPHTPGWSRDALQFLIEERQVKAIGHETFDTDAAIDATRNEDFVSQRYVLEQDIFQIELLTNLDQLPTRGAIIFTICPKANDAPGFPVRAFAIKPK